MANRTYTTAQLWGAVAIAAGLTGLVVGGAVFLWMQLRSNDLEVRIKTLESQANQTSGTPESTTGMGFDTSQAADGVKTTTLPVNGGLSINYPGIYALTQSADNTRRGAFVALDFNVVVQTLVAVNPVLAQLDFFNADSVSAFDQRCQQTPTACADLTYPTSASTFQEFRSIDSGTNGTDGDLKEFNGTRWVVRTELIPGGEGFYRRYASFLGDTRVECTIFMKAKTDAAAADELFKQVTVQPVVA